ncbi:MAG: hypothetical protein HY828_00960 [Actinobacteria bacterium]|nr:hypothetical protein [Actinomycetota bacterium]
MVWICPRCDRQFVRSGQGHECAPAMSLEEYFSTGPPFERPVFEAVMAVIDDLGDAFLEPVSVGIFVKRDGVMVLELRPMTKWVALSFFLPDQLRHSRLSRKPVRSGRRVWHTVNVRDPAEVDDLIVSWITEAWHAAAG